MFVNTLQGKLDRPCQRSNFHIHAGTGPGTCGAYAIDEVIGNYKAVGYTCLCLSNHNLITSPDTFDNQGLNMIQGYEYTSDKHLVCLGARTMTFDPADTSDEALQKAADTCVAEGGFAILCHPHWPEEWHTSREFLDKTTGFGAIEVFNAATDRDVGAKGRTACMNAQDYLLSKGRLVWGAGSDDFHRWWHLAAGWNMIYADNTPGAVIDALKKGEFYVSSGLRLMDMSIIEDRLHVEVCNPSGYVDEYRYRFVGRHGRVLKTVESSAADYMLCGDEGYVRVEVYCPGGNVLLTQPVYDTDFFKENSI
ncbi:MAG: hypothetical protein IK083_00305 [Abditibacteriota bacterium]|nr:hypothetical protein [Abditibacteriota bacterium]